jgi:hypothetical protein
MSRVSDRHFILMEDCKTPLKVAMHEGMLYAVEWIEDIQRFVLTSYTRDMLKEQKPLEPKKKEWHGVGGCNDWA